MNEFAPSFRNKRVHNLTVKRVATSLNNYKNRLASIVMKNPYVENQVDITGGNSKDETIMDFSGLKKANPYLGAEEDEV